MDAKIIVDDLISESILDSVWAKESQGILFTTKGNIITDNERELVSKVFQNYYCMGISEIAEENETANSLFEKIGLL